MYLYKKTIKNCSPVKEATLAKNCTDQPWNFAWRYLVQRLKYYVWEFSYSFPFQVGSCCHLLFTIKQVVYKVGPISTAFKQDESTNHLHCWSSVTLLQAQRSYSWQWYWPGRGWCTPAGVRQCRRRCTCLQQQYKQQRTWHSLRCWLWRQALGSPSETYLQAHIVTICTGTSHQRSHCFYSQNTNL